MSASEHTPEDDPEVQEYDYQPTADRLRMNRRTMLKTTGAAGAAAATGGLAFSSTAAASDATYDEDWAKDWYGGQIARGITSIAQSWADSHPGIDTEQGGREPEQVHLELYVRGLLMDDRRTRWITERSTHLDENFSLAHSDIKIAVANAHLEEKTEEEAVEDAHEAVDEVYSVMQESTWSWQHADVVELDSMRDTIMEEYDDDDLGVTDVFSVEFPDGTREPVQGFATLKDDRTLLNGDEMEVWDLSVSPEGDEDDYRVTVYGHDDEDETEDLHTLYITEPDLADYEDDIAEDIADYSGPGDDMVVLDAPTVEEDVVNKLEEFRQTARNTAEQIAEDIYAEYEFGDLDFEDILTAEERLAMAMTDFSETSSSLYALALAAELGYTTTAIPNFEIEYEPYQYEEGSDDGEVSQIWENIYDGNVRVAHDGSIVYLGIGSSPVIAVDEETGDELWSHSAHSTSIADVDAEDGVVYSAASNEVVAYEDGTEQWTHTHHTGNIEDIYVSDGVVYSGDDEGDVVAADAETGDELWKTNVISDLYAFSLYESNGYVYVGGDAVVERVDAENGSNQETVHTLHTGSVVSIDVTEGVVYSSDRDGLVIAADTETGEELWTHTHHTDRVETVSEDGGIVYSGGYTDETLRAVDSDDASELWNHTMHINGVESIDVNGGYVYSGSGGSGDNNALAVDGTDFVGGLVTDENGNPVYDEAERVEGNIYSEVDPRDSDVLGDYMETGDVYLTPNDLDDDYEQSELELEGWVRMLIQETDGIQDRELDGRFEVSTMRDSDGEEVDSTETQSSDFQTSNTDDMTQQYEDIKQIRQTLDSLTDDDGGGGDTGEAWYDDLVQTLAVGGVALVVIKALLDNLLDN